MKVKDRILSFFNRKFDWWLFFAVIFLCVFSLLALYSLTILGSLDSTVFYKQIAFIVLGLVILFVFSTLNYNSWKLYNRYLYIIAIILLIAVLFFGKEINNTRGWFSIFGFGIQPVEFMKIALIISLSNYLSRNIKKIANWRIFVESAVMTLVPVLLVLAQPDMGSALVLIAIWLAFLLLAALPWKYFFFMFFGLLLISILAWFFVLGDYQKDRILVFVNPEVDPLGAGYNIKQSMIAVGSGALLGRGIGLGSQSQLKFIPERLTDFILAVLGEEFGFLGLALLLILWSIIFWRFFRLVYRAKSNFAYFLVGGIMILFFIHLFVNMGMNLGIMPVVGLSLPFISQGGSFLLVSFLLLGIVENVAINS